MKNMHTTTNCYKQLKQPKGLSTIQLQSLPLSAKHATLCLSKFIFLSLLTLYPVLYNLSGVLFWKYMAMPPHLKLRQD